MSSDHFVSVTLYDRDGSTPIKRLHRAYAMQWLDENDAPGSFNFTIPAEDDTDVAIGRIIKFSYGTRSDNFRWAGVIESITHRLTDDADTVQVSGRGVRALLEGAVVYQGNNETDQTRSFTDAYPSAIMRTLLNEAHARGTLTEITAGFTNNTDSLGVAFSSDTDMTVDVEVGTNLADIADQHQEAVLDGVWVNADLELQYAITRGTDTTETNTPVIFRAMENLVSFEKKIDGPVRNVTLISYSDGEDVTEKVSTVSGTVSTFGRREQFLDLNNVANQTKAERYANKMMKNSASATDGATAEVTDDGVKPYIDYTIGDYVWVVAKNGARTKYRVRALTITADGDGNIRIVPELGTVQANLDERLRKALKRLESRNAKGDASSLTPPQSGLTSTVPSGTLVVGNPIGGEFVYQSPSLKDPIIDTTDSVLSVRKDAYHGVADTGNAAASGAGAICMIGGPNSIVSFNSTDGTTSTLALPGTGYNMLAAWGSRLLACTRYTSLNRIAIITNGVATEVVPTPPTNTSLLLGVGPSASGNTFLAVWAETSSTANLARIIEYTTSGAQTGTPQTFTMPITAGATSVSAARIENGYIAMYIVRGSEEYILTKPADTTSPVQVVAEIAGPFSPSALGNISSDGYAWMLGTTTGKTLYRLDCAEGTMDIYPNALPADQTSVGSSSILSVSKTKAAWFGTTTTTQNFTYQGVTTARTVYHPTIINLVESNGIVNATRSQLDGDTNGLSVVPMAWSPALAGNGDVCFNAQRSIGNSSYGSTVTPYRRFIRVAGP